MKHPRIDELTALLRERPTLQDIYNETAGCYPRSYSAWSKRVDQALASAGAEPFTVEGKSNSPQTADPSPGASERRTFYALEVYDYDRTRWHISPDSWELEYAKEAADMASEQRAEWAERQTPGGQCRPVRVEATITPVVEIRDVIAAGDEP